MITQIKAEEEFIAFKDQLASFIFRLVTNREETEDLVQDTFLKVVENLESFKGKSTFKTWVFSVSTNLAKDHLRKKNNPRWLENAQTYGARLHMASPTHWEKYLSVFQSTPEKEYEVKEHIAYCFNCINKTLELEQQICLLLKDVYSFSIKEMMEITGLSEGKTKHALANARNHMIRIFDNRCALINKKGTCHQCTELTGLLNSEQDAQIKANQIKMVRESANPKSDKEYLLQLRMQLTQSINPLNAKNTLVNTFMLESAPKWVQEGKERNVLEVSSEKES